MASPSVALAAAVAIPDPAFLSSRLGWQEFKLDRAGELPVRHPRVPLHPRPSHLEDTITPQSHDLPPPDGLVAILHLRRSMIAGFGSEPSLKNGSADYTNSPCDKRVLSPLIDARSVGHAALTPILGRP